MKKTIEIEGMSCAHCVMHVRSALEALKGVSRVDVDLKTARAVVEGEGFTEGQLAAAVDDAGYKALRVTD